MIPHIYRYIYNIYIDIFPHCCALKKPEQVPFAGALKSSPGVVAAVLGAAAVLLWAAVTLPFVGTPLGTEVAACAFAVLFTGTGLAVANWGWAPSGCPGCSVFPGAGKSSATGLENVASTDDSGADVPVWIWKGRNCLSLTWTLNGSFKLPFSSSTIREVGKSLVCFSRSRNFYSFPFSFLKCFSMFFLQSRQTISTPAEQQLTPDLATAFKYQGFCVTNTTEDPGSKLQWVELKEQKGGIRQPLKTGTTNWGSFTLAVISWIHAVGQHEAGGLQWHFYVITELLQQEEIYFGITLQSKVSWHTQLPACLPQERLLGRERSWRAQSLLTSTQDEPLDWK